jgi:hypothetical protein
MLDQSDWPEQNSQRNRSSFFSLALFALGAAKFQSRFPNDQALQPHVQLASLAYHAGFFGMSDRPNSLCARLRNDDVANFQVLIENQDDGWSSVAVFKLRSVKILD